ncbi:hypothetical protein Leryth_026015 [Lithospermum erythrorhizon]|nr:hypothetical protein Leryth_026015 [Lithospermum erythrorhizon]
MGLNGKLVKEVEIKSTGDKEFMDVTYTKVNGVILALSFVGIILENKEEKKIIWDYMSISIA